MQTRHATCATVSVHYWNDAKIGKIGKCINITSEFAPTKCSRKENLTKTIPTITEAVPNVMEAHANPGPKSEHRTTRSSGHWVTHKNTNINATHLHNDTRTHHTTDSSAASKVTDKTGHVPKPEMTTKALLTRILVSIITSCQQSFNTIKAVSFQGTRIYFCLFMNFEANTVLVKNYKPKHSHITCC